MKNFIEELYYSNIDPQNSGFEDDAGVQRELRTISENKDWLVGAAINGGFDFAETKVIGNRAYKWFFIGDFTVAGKEPEEPIEVIDTDFEDISNEPADNSFVDPNNK